MTTQLQPHRDKGVSPRGRLLKPFREHGCRVFWVHWMENGHHIVGTVAGAGYKPYLFGVGGKGIVCSLEERGMIRVLGKHQLFRPMLAEERHSACSISPVVELGGRVSGWAGWSHRAIALFRLKDKVFQETPTCDLPEGFTSWDDVPFVKHGEKDIENMLDAEQAARAFARSVS